MSRITINSNQFSLNAQRRLGDATNSLSQSFNRLSSGMRINRAVDDAAGLSVSSLLNADKTISQQGVRNINDGISLVSIADGAISELTNLVIRITELAEQAANGAVGHTQRKALNEEAQELKAEYTRIVRTTEFNDRKILSGDFGELWIQAGYGEAGAVVSGLGGAVGTGSFEARMSFATGNGPASVITGDFNGDGVLDLVTADFFRHLRPPRHLHHRHRPHHRLLPRNHGRCPSSLATTQTKTKPPYFPTWCNWCI